MKDKEEKIIVKEPSIRMQELCNVLGITPTSIRNYEENDAIHVKRKENGYRYYYFNDVLQMLNLKTFINLGLSLKDAKSLSYEANLDFNIKRLEQQSDIIQEKIKFLKHQEEKLERIKHLYKLLKEIDGDYIETNIEGFYWLECQNQYEFFSDNRKDIIAKWNKDSPFFFPACRNKQESLSKTQLADIGLLIFEKDANLFEQKDLKYCDYIPQRKCVITITKSNYKLTDYYSVIKNPLKYLKNNNYDLNGDIISILIATDLMKEDRDDYYDYYLTIFPIKD